MQNFWKPITEFQLILSKTADRLPGSLGNWWENGDQLCEEGDQRIYSGGAENHKN
ncbi:hypothetical protein [Oscillatoria sp. HE19RPO]|uniref:hypothetical protein n=1 Tax=Oscillatoria sp. HE19RPO TaxID=2954806 RepID=UPI0020C23F22|nr:hypothetical protein [Oscillatoria sp. HE19RPO]